MHLCVFLCASPPLKLILSTAQDPDTLACILRRDNSIFDKGIRRRGCGRSRASRILYFESSSIFIIGTHARGIKLPSPRREVNGGNA